MGVLEVKGIDKHFGAVVALKSAALEVKRGEVHVLIGSNGSGKSTLCKIIAGSVIPDAGEIRIEGKTTAISGPQDAARTGIGVFYQELSLVPQLPVAENILLSALPHRGPGLLDRKALRRRAEALMERFAEVAGDGFTFDTLIQDLRSDQRQIVEVLKVLATDARIIIFDEPTSSLDKRQVTVFFNLIRELRDMGRAIIFISHRMDEIFEIGDRVTVLRDGRSVECLRLAETDQDALVQHMVGSRIASASGGQQRVRNDYDDTLLTVENLCGNRLDHVSFGLRRGEILGFGGLHGQGQSLALRILFGAERATDGNVRLTGGGRRPSNPADAIRKGMAYLSGDRNRDGVFLTRPILENLAAADLTKHKRFFLSPQRLVRKISPLVNRLKLRFSGFTAPISSLSGGNQQKAVIGRWLTIQPKILLMDDPTKGIDLHSKTDLYEIMRELVAGGVSIILYSSEDAELIGIADRILVFNSGRIVQQLEGRQMTSFNLYQAAYGVAA